MNFDKIVLLGCKMTWYLFFLTYFLQLLKKYYSVGSQFKDFLGVIARLFLIRVRCDLIFHVQ